jgi:hypothetical protein
MQRYEIFGRDEALKAKWDRKGCAYLGKLVAYPAGRYEEVGAAYLDIVSPHCMLVVGKRGTGKSYTLGVLAEAFALLEREYRERISVIFIDTMSVFHGLKMANTKASETGRINEFDMGTPQGFSDYVRIFVPTLLIEKLQKDGHEVSYDGILCFSLHEVEVTDWLALYGLTTTEPTGVLLVKVLDKLKRAEKPFGFEDIYALIDSEKASQEAKDALRNLFTIAQGLGIFAKHGTPYEKIAKGGSLSVLDISFLGRVVGMDVRNLLVALIGRKLLAERTVYSTLEMQSEAGLISERIDKDIARKHPLIYMIIDEAHLFLPAGYKTFATDVLIDWIKLGRHPGLSVIFATQEPSALHESAIRQADIILAHNVTSNDDVAALGKAKQTFMTGSQDFEKLITTMEFRRGLAVIFDDKSRKMEMIIVRPRMSLHTGIDATAFPSEKQHHQSSYVHQDDDLPPPPRNR